MGEFGSGWEDAPPSTNWREYGLTEIARMFDGGDDAVTSRHERAWMRMQTLCAHHGEQLRRAAEQLARRWPPEQSPASAAFLGRVTQLAGAMDEMATAAVRNAVGVRFITDAVARARAEVAELHRARELDASDLAPQIAEYHRREFDDRARQVMATADSAIVDGYGYLTVPMPPTFSESISPDLESASPNGGANVGSPHLAGAGLAEALPVPSINSPSGSLPSGRGDDVVDTPILDGGIGVAPSGPFPSPGTSGLIPTKITDPVPGEFGGEVIGVNRGIGPANSPVSMVSPSGAARPAGTPLAAGGGIGRASGRGQGGALPPGGMLGARPQTPASSTSAARSGARRRRSDPDDPWQVKQGVPGVLEPDPEPTDHDPGPGVFGLNR